MNSTMKKVLTSLSVILLVIALFFVIYITSYMYFNLGKNPFGKDFFNFFANLLPFISLMILFFLNFVNDCEIINNNIWYKITTIFSLMIIIYMQYRSVFDNNMILWHKTNYHINFDYFNGQLSVIKFMVYGLCVVNILFVIEEYLNNVKKENNGLN